MEEKTYKMSKINEEGKKIVKEVPASLYSQYVNMGWEEVKETKSSSKSNSFTEK